MNSAQILVVDDEAAVRESLRRALALEGYEVELAADGAEALYRLDIGEVQPDAIALDVLMPNVDGLETARRLRGAGNRIPILMLTARDEVEARVAGLDAGADDYVVKPFALAELLARLRALLRRTTNGSGETLHFADLELDPATREVKRDVEPIELTRTEFSLLELFMLNPRQVLTRSLVFERVWGYDFGLSSNSLDVGGPLGFGGGDFVQVVDASGHTYRTLSDAGKLPPNDDALAAAKGRPGSSFSDARIGGEEVRVFTIPVQDEHGSQYALQVARSLGEVNHTLGRITIFLILIAAGGIAIAGGLGLVVSQAALAPVRRLTRATEKVAETRDLSDRIEATGEDELRSLATR